MKKSLIILLLSLAAVVFIPSIVKADGNSGGSGGNANVVGCGVSSFVCTNYGSQWRWYSTEGASNPNNIDIDGGREYTNGYGQKNPSYARGDINVTGCGDVGGYWRYGFVAFRPSRAQDSKWYGAGDWYGRHYEAGYWMEDWGSTWWQVGEQVGMMAIGGNGSADYRSEFFSGGKNLYIGNNWYTVRDLYLRAKKYDQSKYSHEWNSASNLAWFCYAGKSFDAKASVGDSSTDWIIGSNESGEDIKDSGGTTMGVSCGSDDGCETEFKFDLRKVYSYGSTYNFTDYFIQKQSNGTWNRLEEFAADVTSTPSDSGTNVYSVTEKIKPGETICYRIGYKPHGSFNTTTYRYVEACGYNLGNFNSEIDIKVRKNDSGEYVNTSENEPIYARPGEKINLLGTYTPRAQAAASLKPNTVEIIDGGRDENEGGYLIDRFNSLIGSPALEWKNAFSLYLNEKELANATGDIGSSTPYKIEDDYTINVNTDLGKTLEVSAVTNRNSALKTVPKSVAIDAGKTTIATVDTSSSLDLGFVKVPYNFINTTTINNTDLYAGEAATISFSLNVGEKENRKIKEGEVVSYATPVKGAQWKLEMCISEMCISEEEWSLVGTTEPEGENLDVGQNDRSKGIVVPDVPAGTKICLKSSVSPASSGDDTNLDPKGDGAWASDLQCFPVAKRPSLQVWGGNIYSGGEITTSVAKKNKLSGYDDGLDDGLYIFGSWGELGVISNKEVSGLASGAGYAFEKGANNDSFCFVSTLSFANNNCLNGKTGSLKVSLGGLKSDKDFVLDKLTKTDNENTESFPGESEYTVDSGIVYVKNDGGKITINNNIIYSGKYESLESMPKVVIYGENVDIECNVTRIDALIIANGTVNTCSDESDVNKGKRSNHLVINGAVVANKLEANRTYGAGVGDKSGIPAEIINFDSSLYLWGGNETKNDESVYTMSSYTRELAPRY